MNNSQTVALAPDSGLSHADVHGLVGRKCWRANFAYGGELCLHFGRHIAYESPLMKDKKRGEWQLRTRGTAWQVLTPTESFFSIAGSEASLLRKLKCLVGRKVKDISVSNANVLTIEFEGSRLFRVTPTRHDAKSGLPFWELAMPRHMVARFGSALGWTFEPSNVPKTGRSTKAARSKSPMRQQT
jgi:hypothetical protein